jgi:hypothetical protein
MDAMDQERVAREREKRRRHLLDCQRHRARPGDKRTTPPPIVDVTAIAPELAGRGRTAVRLHPRFGPEAPPDASKLGGAFAWPSGEPWPVCAEHGIPYVGVLQLRKDDFPERPFPDGADLFQLLWCPRDHEMWIRPAAFWRRMPAPSEQRPADPLPEDQAFLSYVPVPCLLMPERVVEYPCQGLTAETEQKLRDHFQGQPFPPRVSDGYEFYLRQLSVCPGSKIGGYVAWLQGDETPTCTCGRPMGHLLTLASEEISEGRWLPEEERELFDGSALSTWGWANAPGLQFGDLGNIYLFVCRHCEDWPIRHVGQC